MAGSLGEVWYDIVARDRTQEGLASATASTAKATAEIEKATAGAGKSMLKMARSGAQEISQLGMGIAMLGNVFSNASIQAKIFGINLGGLEPVIGSAGVALGTLGSTMTMMAPLQRAWGALMYGTLIPSIQAAVVATYAWVAANAALTLGLSLVVAGLAIWYTQTLRNASAEERLKTAQAKVEEQAHDTKTEIEKLTDKLKELETVQNRLAGIAGDVSQADRDHQRAVLDLGDAQTDYNAKVSEREKIEKALTQVSQISAETGIPEGEVRRQLTAQLTAAKDEETRAYLDLGDAQAREQTTLAALNRLLAERVDLMAKENNLLADRPRLLSEIRTAQADLLMLPLTPGQLAGFQERIEAAGTKGGVMGTTTITIGTIIVPGGQTVSDVLADLAARNQSKNRAQSGVPL